MRIAINALSARTGGGCVYLRNLIRESLENRNMDTFIVFVTRENRDKIVVQGHDRLVVIAACVPNRLLRLLYEQAILPVILAMCNADVLFAPAEIAPLLSPCPIVLGLQNANIYARESVQRDLLDRGRNAVLFLLAWLSVRRARELIFVSNFARQQASSALGIDPHRGNVVYHGIDPIFLEEEHEAVREGSSEGGAVLCVGAISPHKNLECLIDAYLLIDSDSACRHPLMLVGPVVDETYHRRIIRKLRDGGLDPDKILVGETPLDRLPAVYRGASVFVFPSMVETFGIPLLEAMASGVPVLAADASCIPEVVGDAAILFDSRDPRGLADTIHRLLTDPELRRDLIVRGTRRAEGFTWRKSTDETLRVLHRAAVSGTKQGALR